MSECLRRNRTLTVSRITDATKCPRRNCDGTSSAFSESSKVFMFWVDGWYSAVQYQSRFCRQVINDPVSESGYVCGWISDSVSQRGMWNSTMLFRGRGSSSRNDFGGAQQYLLAWKVHGQESSQGGDDDDVREATTSSAGDVAVVTVGFGSDRHAAKSCRSKRSLLYCSKCLVARSASKFSYYSIKLVWCFDPP